MAALRDFSQYLHIKEGFCHPDWESIAEVIEGGLPESDWNAAWENAARMWVERIGEKLGEKYQTHETENFLILSEASPRVMRHACQTYEDSLSQILANLPGVASDEGYGKHVVLMFADLDDYYEYITYFYPKEGEHPMTGGVCLGGEGYLHFAFPTTDYSSYRTVLVHELTHGCLAHLPIPNWINEALAMRMEELVCGSHIFFLDREIYDKHVSHWNEDTIQQFWSGESWEIPGDSFELSYNLAQVLWRKVEVDLEAPREAILEFVSSADFKDAGEEAFRSIFDLSLRDLVMDFLGEGPWVPDPSRWGGGDDSENSYG